MAGDVGILIFLAREFTAREFAMLVDVLQRVWEVSESGRTFGRVRNFDTGNGLFSRCV
jgi:hypothetical protein